MIVVTLFCPNQNSLNNMLEPKPINNLKLSPFQEADLASFQTDCDPWIYRKLGAQKIGQAGNKLDWSFAVWAPAAQSVDLVIYPLYDPPLEFPLEKVGVSGVWQFSVGNLPVLKSHFSGRYGISV